MDKENILFYSGKCEYSSQILALITNNNIRDKFVFISIDNNEYKLPTFVDRVPMILIKNKNELVIDEHLPIYIETLVDKVSETQQPSSILSLSDLGHGFSDNYSFLGGNEHANPKNFVFVNQDENTHASSASASAAAAKNNKFDSSEYEKFTSQRDLDEASFKQPRKI